MIRLSAYNGLLSHWQSNKKRTTTTTALVDSRDGELKFISGTESDASSGDNLESTNT